MVDAVRCAVEVQTAMIERNAGVPPEKRIEFRVGVHLGDVVEESDGDLMGDGVNIAARLEGIAKPGAICLSEDAYRQVKGRLDLKVSDLGLTQLKNIAEPIRVYSLQVGAQADAKVATLSAPAQLSAASVPRRRSVLALSALAIALLLAAGAATWHFVGANRSAPIASTPSAEAAHLSIVVLPFTNLSGDPTQDYFADGTTENLTTDLSRQESVREHHAGLHSFRSMRRMEARRRKARALWLRHSQSLASRRQRPSQAKVRSTIQRLGSATNPVA